MTKVYRILLLLALLINSACSDARSPTFIVCEGIETTKITKGQGKGGSESQRIQKTFRFSKEVREVKTNHYLTEINIREGKVTETPRERKEVWVAKIDGGLPLYDEDAEVITVNAPHPNKKVTRASVIVSDEMIGINLLDTYMETNTKHETFRKYSVNISRISGAFTEETLEGSNDPPTGFHVKTIGNCKPGEKKF